MITKDTNMELLSPAGDEEKLDSALRFGADAVYLSLKTFGMRVSAGNFDAQGLRAAVSLAHSMQRRVYVTCNTMPLPSEMDALCDALTCIAEAGADALIIADMGVLELAAKYAGNVERHISTQFGVTNHVAAGALCSMGAKRVVLARELSLEDIAEIRAKTPAQLELECFVHGSMCMSVSGRCLLSDYLAGRSANRGACTQPCRWNYYLSEEKRPGVFLPIEEGEGYTRILSAEDLCMLKHLDDLQKAGVTSLKIEGRSKAAYYAAAVSAAYRGALDSLYACPQGTRWSAPQWCMRLLERVSHRAYGTGFYYGRAGQNPHGADYIRAYQVAAVCEGYEGGRAYLTQRNRFFADETLDVLSPGRALYSVRARCLEDAEGTHIDAARQAMMRCSISTDESVAPGSYLIRCTGNDRDEE